MKYEIHKYNFTRLSDSGYIYLSKEKKSIEKSDFLVNVSRQASCLEPRIVLNDLRKGLFTRDRGSSLA